MVLPIIWMMLEVDDAGIPHHMDDVRGSDYQPEPIIWMMLEVHHYCLTHAVDDVGGMMKMEDPFIGSCLKKSEV